MNSSSGQRRFTRVPIKLRVEIYADDAKIECEETRDVSLSGVYLVTSRQLPLGTRCRIVLLLGGPNSDLEVQLDGQIVRVDSGGMAAEFTAMSIDSFYHLRNLVMHNYGDVEVIEQELHEHLTRQQGFHASAG